MNAIGSLIRSDDGFEFRYEELNLTIRGEHAEWVLEAASELIADATRLEAECRLEELTVLVESGDANTAALDADRHDFANRYEQSAKCVVTMGSLDYRWVSNAADAIRKETAKAPQAKHYASCAD